MNQLELLAPYSKTKNSKSQIISVLGERWPLTTKEVFSELQKQFGTTISYQAIHKVLQEMIDEQIVVKNGKSYELNNDWISNLTKFSSTLKEQYSGSRKKYALDKNFEGTVRWEFDDYSIMCVEMAKIFGGNVLVGKGKPQGFAILRHAWWPLNFRFMDFTILATIMKNNQKGYGVIESDTPFDNWIAKQYRAVNFTGVKTGEKGLNLKKDLAIHGESLVEITYSDETKKMLDEVYSQTRDLGDLFKHYVKQAISKTPVKIEVTITRNPELAALLFDQFREKYFGAEGK